MLFIGKDNSKVLYKDNKDINHKSMYLESSKTLADLIKKAKKENNYYKYFLDESLEENKKHNDLHLECDMKETDNSRVTEKRICRCIRYYDKESEKCKLCNLGVKYNNISKRFKVIDAEKPMKRVIKSCGGIDLIIKDTNNCDLYAVEVKPQYSKETLVRMIAEITTYTIDTPEYKKAIGFFENSVQEKDYFNEEYNKDDNFKYILSQVHVFRFNLKKQKGSIQDYEIELIQ